MEQSPGNAIIVAIPNLPENDELKPTPIRPRKRKNGGPMHALKVALFMMRGRSKKSNALPVDDESKNVWRKLVGSMRPLHLQSNQSPRSHSLPNHITLPPCSPSESIGGCSAFTDVLSEEEPYSPSPTSSRYASAVGLNELVQSDEENEKHDAITEVCNGGEGGDEKIDAKADEFIAQFYQQMRLQRMNNVDRHYHERSQRSLGW